MKFTEDLGNLEKTGMTCDENKTCYDLSKEKQKYCRPCFDPSRKSFMEILKLTNMEFTITCFIYILSTVILQENFNKFNQFLIIALLVLFENFEKTLYLIKGDSFRHAWLCLFCAAIIYSIFIINIQDKNTFDRINFCLMVRKLYINSNLAVFFKNPYDKICNDLPECSDLIDSNELNVKGVYTGSLGLISKVPSENLI